MDTSTKNFITLPTELVIDILAATEDFTTLTTLAQTNRRFYEIYQKHDAELIFRLLDGDNAFVCTVYGLPAIFLALLQLKVETPDFKISGPLSEVSLRQFARQIAKNFKVVNHAAQGLKEQILKGQTYSNIAFWVKVLFPDAFLLVWSRTMASFCFLSKGELRSSLIGLRKREEVELSRELAEYSPEHSIKEYAIAVLHLRGLLYDIPLPGHENTNDLAPYPARQWYERYRAWVTHKILCTSPTAWALSVSGPPHIRPPFELWERPFTLWQELHILVWQLVEGWYAQNGSLMDQQSEDDDSY